MAAPGHLLRSIAGYLAGIALGTACLTLVFLGMRAVMDVGGACADGGPYVSAQPCPEGVAVAMTGGIFGLFAAGGLIVWFGSRLGAGYAVVVALGWPALFFSLGWNFFEYGLDPPGDEPGPVWGWVVPGVVFWLMAGIPLVVGLAGLREARSGRPVRRVERVRQRFDLPSRRIEFAPNSFGVPRPASATAPGPVSPAAAPAAPSGVVTANPAPGHPSPAAAPAAPSGVVTALTTEEDAIDEALVDRLERLAELHRSGALTEDEFAAAKARILAGQDLDG